MSKRKYLVTYPTIGYVTLEVEASSIDDAKSKFLDKASEIKLKGDVLQEPESNHSFEFLEEVNTRNVFNGIIQQVIIELPESRCPFGGICVECCCTM